MAEAPLLCIMGPTAAGKTDLAIDLAQALNGELVSVDSALIYRGLDIGAAKPEYPHHLIDIRDPCEYYSAADFVVDAEAVIAGIRARGRLPILVGGTLLYFRALLQGLDDIPATDPAVRAELMREAEQRGWPALHGELARVDPQLAAQLHPNHSQRIGRGLEVWRMTGRPLSAWQTGVTTDRLNRSALCLAICPEQRSDLHRRIEMRFDAMLDAGFLNEIRTLYQRGDLSPELPAVRAVGYRQLWPVVASGKSLAEARLEGIAATRQLAKRQLTWLRSWPQLTWLFTDATHGVTGIGGECVLADRFRAALKDKIAPSLETMSSVMVKIIRQSLGELHSL